MATKTFGDLPVATTFGLADQIAAWQAATTVTVTKALLLTAKSGEAMQISSFAGSLAGYNSGGDYIITQEAGKIFQVKLGGDALIQINSVGQVSISGPAGHGVTLSDTVGAVLQINGLGQVQMTNAGGTSVDISFLPSASGDWAGDPTSYKDAVNRIAAEVALLKGSPIS